MLMLPLSYIHASEAARTTAGGGVLRARGGGMLTADGGGVGGGKPTEQREQSQVTPPYSL
jgi:hypothetical protein